MLIWLYQGPTVVLAYYSTITFIININYSTANPKPLNQTLRLQYMSLEATGIGINVSSHVVRPTRG